MLRRLQRFPSQPFFVAKTFPGLLGRYVSIEETVASFKEIVAGKYDDLPESAFYMAGGIEDVVAKAGKAKKGENSAR